MKRSLIVILIVLFVSVGLSAKTIHIPLEYGTIQEGIDASLGGDTVLVADGVYTGEGNRNIFFYGKAITLASENGPESTIIDCNYHGCAIVFYYGEDFDTIFQGFTVQNGDASSGGAIDCVDASPTIRNCIFKNNNASHIGGALKFSGSFSDVIDCVITENTSATSAGGIDSYSSKLNIENCTITRNHAGKSQTGYGGGIWFGFDSACTVSNCIISNNSATEGGGVHCNYQNSVTLQNCVIQGNSANKGGGIQLWNSTSTILNCTISDNNATINAGGIDCWKSQPVLSQCTISGNSAGELGGGLSIGHQSELTISGCTFSHNTAEQGGAIACFNSSIPIIGGAAGGGNYFDQNMAEQGDELFCVTLHSPPINAQFNTFSGYYYSSNAVYPLLAFDLGNCASEQPLGCRIEMPSDNYGPGQECYCQVIVSNPTVETLRDQPVFVCLDIYGTYYFAPRFATFDYYPKILIHGDTVIDVLPSFSWPEGAGSATGINWHAAMTNMEMTDLFGEMDTFTFGWHQ